MSATEIYRGEGVAGVVSGFFDASTLPGAQIVLQTLNPAMREVLQKVSAAAPTETTVLLTGETGSGKNVLARVLHYHSRRRDYPFVSVQCSAVAESLLESELFGHEKGSFTGAVKRRLGKFELAHRGTILLDEIGTISSAAQLRLLQILEEKEFHRVGGEELVKVDVRIVAATNSDLTQLTEDGTFRSDLYYRLNVFPIEVPSLRDRLEDIPFLVEVLLGRLEKTYKKNLTGVEPAIIDAFQRYSWPGNIRELENMLERAYILETTSILRARTLPADFFRVLKGTLPAGAHDTSRTLREIRDEGIRVAEAAYLKAVLAKHRGHMKESAANAGVTTRQLLSLMKKHGLRKEQFR